MQEILFEAFALDLRYLGGIHRYDKQKQFYVLGTLCVLCVLLGRN